MKRTPSGETELRMVERHVAGGERILAERRAPVARLKARRLPTERAEQTLGVFQRMRDQHLDHLARIEESREGRARSSRPRGGSCAHAPRRA